MISTYIGRRVNLYWSANQPILLRAATYIGSPADQYRFNRESLIEHDSRVVTLKAIGASIKLCSPSQSD